MYHYFHSLWRGWEGPPPLSCVLMSVGFTVVGFGMGLGFKMVMLQMRKLRLSSRAREEGGRRRVSGDAGLGADTKLRGGTVGAGIWERCVGWGAGAAAGWDGCPQWVARIVVCGLARTARPRSCILASAGPWETVGFGILGAYGLNKLDELEQWAKAKYQVEFTRKLERNRVRARRPPLRTRTQRRIQSRVAPPRGR